MKLKNSLIVSLVLAIILATLTSSCMIPIEHLMIYLFFFALYFIGSMVLLWFISDAWKKK